MIRRLTTRDTSTILLNFRVTPEEGDKIKGLAWYLGCSYSELFREYEAALRKALLRANMRPPLQAPDEQGRRTRKPITIDVRVLVSGNDGPETEMPESRGPKTPRRKP